MEQSTAYLMMIFLPVIPWFLKITVSYRIRYKTPKLKVDKFYKKHKTSFAKKFFYTDLKSKIQPFAYYANFLIGCLLLASVLLSVVYLILAIFKYTLSVFWIPYVAMYVTLILAVFLIVYGTIEIIDDRRAKK